MADQKNVPRRGVLGDHRRVGKRFIPPMLAEFTLGEAKWIDELMPELLWIHLVHRARGYASGAETALQVARAALEVKPNAALRWFAFTGCFSQLNPDERAAVSARLEKEGVLAGLRQALAPLGAFYPNCALAFLWDRPPTASIGDFKEALAQVFNRWGVEGTRLQATAVYLAFDAGFLKLAPESKSSLQNFPAVAAFPDTEESRAIAAAVRSTISAISPFNGPADAAWPEYFWQRGLEIEPCRIFDLGEDQNSGD